MHVSAAVSLLQASVSNALLLVNYIWLVQVALASQWNMASMNVHIPSIYHEWSSNSVASFGARLLYILLQMVTIN